MILIMEQDELVELEIDAESEVHTGSVKKLVLWNDNFNTFEHVISCLVKFLKKTAEEATEITFTVHNEGKCVVLEGHRNELVEYYNILHLKNLTVSIE
jgi:ATP-dependent Clp protease adaptor protein ClpS